MSDTPLPRYWVIQARVIKKWRNESMSVGVPTFVIDRYIQGCLTKEHIIKIAKSIIDPFSHATEYSISAEPSDFQPPE